MSTSLRPIKRPKSLRNQVYTTLLEGLRSGLISGDKLLVERELATQLGVSRTPVREALALLESGGILVATGRGFMLTSLSDSEIQDIYEIRRLLEPHALRCVSSTMGKNTLNALEKFHNQQQHAHENDDAKEFSEANRRFRACWIEKLSNRRLATAIELYDDHVVFLRKLTLQEKKYREEVISSLDKLMQALLKKDEEATEKAMSAHLARAEKSLRRALRESIEDED